MILLKFVQLCSKSKTSIHTTANMALFLAASLHSCMNSAVCMVLWDMNYHRYLLLTSILPDRSQEAMPQPSHSLCGSLSIIVHNSL